MLSSVHRYTATWLTCAAWIAMMTADPAPKFAANLRDAEQFLLPTYKRQPILFTHGRGCYVFDSTGKKYLDFLGGIAVNALGHAHPRIMKLIAEQAHLIIHTSNLYYHQYQGPLAKRIAQASGLQRVFFGNTGTEVVEGALKMAKAHGKRIRTG